MLVTLPAVEGALHLMAGFTSARLRKRHTDWPAV